MAGRSRNRSDRDREKKDRKMIAIPLDQSYFFKIFICFLAYILNLIVYNKYITIVIYLLIWDGNKNEEKPGDLYSPISAIS